MKKITIVIAFLVSSIVTAQLKPVLVWSNIYDGIGKSIDMTNDALIDKDYNLYLAGRSAGIDGSQDLLILKYSRYGKLISEIRYFPTPASWDEGTSIDIDTEGNMYCTGNSSFGTSSPSAIIQKYSSDGKLLRNKNFLNSSEQYSEGIKIKIDKSNNIVVGYHLNGACFTKYTQSFDSLWTVKISNSMSNFKINDIIIDPNNNVYTVLTQYYFAGGDVPEQKVFLSKYDQNGNSVWNKSLDLEYPRKLIFDNESNLLLESNGKEDLVKFNSNGDSLWTYSSNGIMTDIKVDKENNILLSGYLGGINGTDCVLKKLTSSGIEVWSATFNSNENLHDYASAIVVDNDNNVYVTGSSNDMLTQGTCFILKYNSAGGLQWRYKYDAPHSKFEQPFFIFLDDSNNVFIGGDVADSTNGWNFFALKISQKLGATIEEDEFILPINYSLSQNYPNPFNPETTISYSLSKSEHVTLKVFDVLGREVATLVDESKQAGTYNSTFNTLHSSLTSGIYFYRLQSGGYSETKKMLIIK